MLTLLNQAIEKNIHIIDTVVYHIGRNCVFYIGDYESCANLEFTDSNLIAMPLGMQDIIMEHVNTLCKYEKTPIKIAERAWNIRSGISYAIKWM